MGQLSYNLGKIAAPHVHKARWVWKWAAGTQAESIKAEYEVGLNLAARLRQKLITETDSQPAKIVNEIGSSLAMHVANKLFKFTFEILKDVPPNAFALPGGFIFISAALLESAQFEKDEIAFVLGHEMAHVIRGHAIERVISNSAVILGTKSIGSTGILKEFANSVAIKLLQSAYSQNAELEADTLGILLADASGYNPKAAMELLSKFKAERQSPLESYFSSHPQFDIRIQNARQVIELK